MIVFAVLAALMLIGAVLVVTLRQPVHAALALVGTLLTLAIAYLQLHAHFLAAIQVIVYAGAIMVLFLFVIMLLNVSGREMPGRLRALAPMAWTAGIVAAAGIGVIAFTNPRPLPEPLLIAEAIGGGDAARLGDVLFSRFLLPFHLVGVLLLTGIVGAVGLVQRSVAASADEQARSGSPARMPGEPPPSDLPGRAPVAADGRR